MEYSALVLPKYACNAGYIVFELDTTEENSWYPHFLMMASFWYFLIVFFFNLQMIRSRLRDECLRTPPKKTHPEIAVFVL